LSHPFRKKWGQNFLRDKNIIRKIVDVLAPAPDDTVLEIGPGSGALTHELAERSRRVVAVEVDPLLIPGLKDSLPENVNVIQGDILKFDLSHMPEGYRVIGNLPYYITTPILFRVLESPRWRRTVFMVQKEVGARMTASPGSKEYGRLSVMVQALAKVEKSFPVPPTVFYPQPSVWSVVISLEPSPDSPKDMSLFSEIVKQAFSQRRKKLRNTLYSYFRRETEEKYGELRAEQLAVEDYIEIMNACLKRE